MTDDGDGVVDVHPGWAELIYTPGAIPDSLCVVSRLSYASILPKCSCAVIDGGHAITGISRTHDTHDTHDTRVLTVVMTQRRPFGPVCRWFV
jgi:hypothetical protein